MSFTTASLFHPALFSRFRNGRQQPAPNNGDNVDMGAVEAGVAQTATPNANDNNNNGNATTNNKKPSGNSTSDSLFGPNIGLISPGPSWTLSNQPRKTLLAQDELTPEIVKSWIEKSKEPSYPTTTLQALVNLKRPSIRLSPLTTSSEDQRTYHGFEFTYDADSPKCGVYISVLLPRGHPDAPPEACAETGLARLVVFEMVGEGGFGKVVKVEDEAVLDLVRFEGGFKEKLGSADGTTPPPATATAAPAETASHPGTGTTAPNRRRFTNFHFRRRSSATAAGPALAVMDAETPHGADKDDKSKAQDQDEEGGVKLTIRLAALDEQGRELENINEQVTYLHVVRLGATPAEDEEDKRPWVVKVVKREATIGPHTFHLHEIYGLSSSSAGASSQTSPHAPSHTYPPEESHDDDSPSSECLLCLSSPREVVLLPCRHLVACKECALNMVEFGAGGTVVQPVENDNNAGTEGNAEGQNATEGNAEGGAAGTGNGGGETQAAPTTPPATTTRRKRKAKGWFCPVCRQPYTSLLRITTVPPPAQEKEEKDEETEAEGDKKERNEQGCETDITDAAATNAGGGGLLGSVLRGLSSTSLTGRGDASERV